MFLLLSFAAPAWAAPNARFKSTDGIALAADYTPPKRGRPVLVLLHGVAAARSEWNPLVARLPEKGLGALALDFRGHGDSGGPKFDTFKTTESWAKLERDIQGAIAYLRGRGVGRSRIGLVGASLGANLAVRAAAAEGGLACAALLSPGIEYRGLGVVEPASRIAFPLLMAASSGDRYAFETIQYLRNRLPAAAYVQAARGHGAQMLADADFTARLLAWLEESCRKPLGTAASP